MTGYTVHTGSTVKFSSSWDRIFNGNSSSKKTAGTQTAKSATPVKAPTNAAAMKSSTKIAKRPVKKAVLKKSGSKTVKRGK